ncbi:MAG TPA: hypothetical protein VM692_16715 [Gammaproteobacteria bacterium]|nr:hypothetical protein [Gammaproteobacteria bacterium]
MKAALPQAPTGWLIGGYEVVSAGRRGSASSAAAHSLVVTVEGDPARIDSLLGSIDFPALAATLAP